MGVDRVTDGVDNIINSCNKLVILCPLWLSSDTDRYLATVMDILDSLIPDGHRRPTNVPCVPRRASRQTSLRYHQSMILDPPH